MSEFALRRACERLAGPELTAYVLHLRPMEWPIMSAHFLVGALLAAGIHLPVGPLLAGWFIFVVLLNGGTLAINSAFDQDEGDVAYLRRPPKPPRHLALVSGLMLAAALLLGFLLPSLFAGCNAACVAMSVLYSVPPARLKARAGWDLLINAAGFGALTLLAGWGLTGRPLPAGMVPVAIGYALLFGSLYPTTQIYQMEEDRARGDRTLVLGLGESLSLGLAVLLVLGAHALFAWGALRLERPPLALLVSLAAWLGVLLPWWARWRRMNPRQHQAGMYWCLGAWAVTDLSVLLLLWPR